MPSGGGARVVDTSKHRNLEWCRLRKAVPPHLTLVLLQPSCPSSFSPQMLPHRLQGWSSTFLQSCDYSKFNPPARLLLQMLPDRLQGWSSSREDQSLRVGCCSRPALGAACADLLVLWRAQQASRRGGGRSVYGMGKGGEWVFTGPGCAGRAQQPSRRAAKGREGESWGMAEGRGKPSWCLFAASL